MSDSLDKIMYSFVVDDVLKGFFIHVPPGYIACVYDLGRGVLKKVYEPGLHLKIPFWQKAKLFNTQTLEYNVSDEFDPSKPHLMGDIPIICSTADKENLSLQGTVLLRLDAERIPEIWQNIGEDVVEKIDKDYGNDFVKKQERVRLLLKERRVSPWSRFVVLGVQLLVLVLLYQVFMDGINASEKAHFLYSFVSRPDFINTKFLWFDIE